MESDIQVISCTVAEEEYAIDIRNVQEIIKLLDITRVPRVCSCIEGVINLRGMVIPVMNMRKRFCLPDKTPDETSRIVIINWGESMIGMLVDSASEVIRLPEHAVESPPSVKSNINLEFFSGIGKLGNRLLIMLDLEKVFDI
ncbi:MAG: chemotaxis protein CheW [Firmicutes bacterium HGW-Firmicutes-14]|nr:MAG: chemotaxis protein CheW [Firmicutes bacterium HGW-Firmicutes-14]